MAAPAWKYEDEDAPTAGHHNTKPYLHAVPGGSEATEPGTPSPPSVDSDTEATAADQITPPSDAEAEEAAALDDQTTPDNNPKDKKKPKGPFGRLRARSNARRNLIIGSGLTGVILSVFGFISFIAPFRITQVVKSIESRVGNVPEYAVERRLEFYVSRYLIMRNLENSGIDINTDRRFTYLGQGPMRTFYTTWRGSKMDAELLEKGIKITPLNKDVGLGSKYTLPTNWQFEIDGKPVSGVGGLESRESRRLLNNIANENLEAKNVIKRWNNRRVLRKYFGIERWKPFENGRNRIRNKYYEAKKSFREFVSRPLNRLQARVSIWTSCITDSNPVECRKKLREPSQSSGTASSNPDTSEADNQVDDVLEAELKDGADEAVEETVAKSVGSGIEEISVKKILLSGVAGIGILQFASHMEQSISNGTLSQVNYDRLVQQSTRFTAPFLSANDQLLSGDDVGAVHAQVLSDIIGQGTASPAYQGLFNPLPAGKQIRRDCNDNGTTTDPEDLLPPGETVCPNQKFVQNPTQFTSSQDWQTLHTFFEGYRKAGGDALTEATKKIMDTLLVEPVKNALGKLVEVAHVAQISAAALSAALSHFFGPGITGMEHDQKAVDAIIAGISGLNSSFGGGVGPSREDTIGGAYLTNDQVTAIRAEQQDQRNYELKQQTFLARYFSPSTPESLTAQAIMATPNSMQHLSSSLMSYINPVHLFGRVGGAFTTTARADSSANPFGALRMGYPPNSEVFNMEPDVLAEKYNCNLAPDRRPQNQVFGRPDGLPFDVYTQTDPCFLDQAALDVGTRYLNKTYDEGIDGTSRAPATANNNKLFILGDSYTIGMRQFADLETKLTGWQTTIDAACGRPLVGSDSFSACGQPPAVKGLGAVDITTNKDAITNAGTVVVALGTNDLAGSPDTFRANVREMAAKIHRMNSHTRLYWVNLYVNNAAKPAADAFNKILTEEATANNFTVIDWASKAPNSYNPNDDHPKDYAPLVDLIVNSLGPAPQTSLQQAPSHQPLLGNFASLPRRLWQEVF